MSPKPSWKPEGYTSVSPYLICKGAQRVIDFLEAALDATVLRRYDMPDGTIMHAEMKVGDSVVMIGEAGDAWPAVPTHVHVYVEDVDAVFARALEAGATELQKPSQRGGDDPDRRGGVMDPAGNSWWFGTQLAG
jgi:PhnB protein